MNKLRDQRVKRLLNIEIFLKQKEDSLFLLFPFFLLA
jgi:hypothetical protein